MAAAAPHRGSGATAVWVGPEGAVVAQRRSGAGPRSGRQPAPDVVVVADARLDNAVELRRALVRSGHLPDGPVDDPAVLLAAAYAAWGEGLGSRLLGDFAVVVWDRRRRTVVALRDPMAMRSLFYRHDDGRLLFGTEVKQVLAGPGVVAEPDEAAVLADLVGDFGRSDRSSYRGVEQLPPGCTLVSGPDGSTVRRFWDVDPHHSLVGVSASECAEELRRMFLEAVEARLDPGAPTGVLLSGGMDSGSVASAAGWLRERDPGLTPELRSYSWAFAEHPECDERAVSDVVVARYGLVPTDVPADGNGALACYPEHAPDLDDPFLGGFQPLIEHALALARDHGVGVLLGGDRGDLLVGDTGLRHLDLLRAGRWAALRTAMAEQHRVLNDPWTRMVAHHLVGGVVSRLRRRSLREWGTWLQARAGGATQDSTVPAWVRAELLDRVDIDGAVSADHLPPGLDAGQASRYRYVFTPMHLRGVAWSERTYARYGLGFADPFSDRRLVELVVALPQAALNRPGDPSKPLMREAVRGLMPEAARLASAKVDPSPLFESSLARRSELVRALLTAPLVEQRGWVDAAALLDHYEAWLSGGSMDPRFWWALQTELWLREQARS
jgi:asparagine synthase (glutamine-hydrolysing)